MIDLAPGPLDVFQTSALYAAQYGFSLRVRAESRLEPEMAWAAIKAGTVAFLAPPFGQISALRALSEAGGVHIILASPALSDSANYAILTRNEIESGASIAFASGYRPEIPASTNAQFLLQLAVNRFGMTLREAITALTYNAACSLRLSGVAGSLEPGKPADMIAVDVPDYRELLRRAGQNDTAVVIRAGRVVYRRAGLVLE